jgi:hypothetical protein
MARQLINTVVAIVALGCIVIAGASIAWSSIASPAGGRAYMTKTDFDQVFADATTRPRPENTPANREKLRDIGWNRIKLSR